MLFGGTLSQHEGMVAIDGSENFVKDDTLHPESSLKQLLIAKTVFTRKMVIDELLASTNKVSANVGSLAFFEPPHCLFVSSD